MEGFSCKGMSIIFFSVKKLENTTNVPSLVCTVDFVHQRLNLKEFHQIKLPLVVHIIPGISALIQENQNVQCTSVENPQSKN